VRRLDWFLAGVVAAFLVTVAVIETASFSLGAVGFNLSNTGGVGEVAMRRLVSHLPGPPILGVDPQ
jgi:uncharacterized membrane protein